MIDPDLGYWIGECTDLPGLTHLAIAADGLAAARLEDRAWVAGAKRAPKSFYVNALNYDDPLTPLLIEYGRKNPPYPGAQLSHVGVFISGLAPTFPWTKYRGTQFAHFDANDPRHVKLFVNLTPVYHGADCALTFWPADYSAPFNLGKARVNERELDYAKSISLHGPPGTALLLDASRCIHYGSRGGKRITLVIHYCTNARKYSTRPSERYEDLNVAGQGENHAILGS